MDTDMLDLFNRKKAAAQQEKQFYRLKASQLENLLRVSAATSDRPGTAPQSDRKVLVSLTTFAQRIDNVYLTIESLLQQSLPPDRLVLWLSREEFRPEDVPAILRKQEARGLEVRFCDRDLGPYKKIVPALHAFPDHRIITVDDDVMYPVDLVDRLYRAHCRRPDVIHAARAHYVRFRQPGELAPYREWKAWPDGADRSVPAMEVMPTGIGGVIYFPGCFADEVLNEEAFLALAPFADDVWLKAMSTLKGVQSQVIQDPRVFASRYLFIDGSQVVALKRRNKSKVDGNDLKLKAVFDRYALYSRFRDGQA